MFNKIIQKFTKKQGETSSHLIKTFFVYGFFTLAVLLSRVLIARFYGQEFLGIFTYFFSLVSLVFLFTSFGLPEAITQTIIKDSSRLKQALKYYLPLISLTTVLFVVLTLIITNYFNLNPTLKYFDVAVILYLIIYTFFYTTYSILRGFKKFVAGSFYSLVGRVFFIIFILLSFYFSLSSIYILFGISLSVLISGVISLPQITKLFEKTKSHWNQKKFLYLAFSLFLMQVGFYSLRFISEIVIGYLVDFQSLGLYSAHSSITNTVRLVAYVFPVVVLPMAAISKFKLRTSLKKILGVLVPFALLVLMAAYIFVPLFYGAGYKSQNLPLALVFSSTLLVVYSYLNSVLVGENVFSKKYLKIIGFDFILSLLVNTSLNVWLILKWGIIGAPIATAITIILKILWNLYGIKQMRRRNNSKKPYSVNNNNRNTNNKNN